MSSQSWRKSPVITERLVKAPQAYRFFQAVRLLERSVLYKDASSPLNPRLARRNAAGLFTPPSTEVVRFKSRVSFSYPNSEVYAVVRNEGALTVPWEMQVNFMGLAGASGVMPYHYTELMLQRLKHKDDSLVNFLDLFNHRTVSLFYQAGTKYSLPIQYERKQLINKNSPSNATTALLSMIGLGTGGMTNRMHIRDESLLFYGGLLTQKNRTSRGLQQILSDYFDLPIQIQEFVGHWQDLLSDIRTRMGSRTEPLGRNAALGKSAMLGSRGWIAQGKIRILIGPLNGEQFHRFAPGTKALVAMHDMVQFYLGLEHDYEFVIEVKRADLPPEITLSKKSPPILSWNTWLANNRTKTTGDNNETFTIRVSAKRAA